MEYLSEYIIPVIILALLSAGWLGVQLMARKMNTRNHIDHGGDCCGGCENEAHCSNKMNSEHNPDKN